MATRSADGRPIGVTCNSFISVSLSPPLVLWCLALYSPNLPVFQLARYFSINLLSADQQALSRQFATPFEKRFAGVDFAGGIEGVPLITGCAAHLECRNETRHFAGDHIIFIGRGVRLAHTASRPLIFSAGQHGSLPAPL